MITEKMIKVAYPNYRPYVPGDVPNPNYVYVRFDTEEEVQKALKDISSWKSQSDGHDKLEKWDLIDILD